ncbi:hypothetical protein SI65_02878 [Aspergillus cristatus]|uniref:HNH nuclease domain-containing protein n=1 Tax=Aspergillus cristatus TaxID=573508 RepID=A0A1E3BM39_ASPCR|nr:hypothetical protein SI65_02878 [Aspergillus cristatus]
MAAAPELEQQGQLEAITSLCHALESNETSMEAWLAAWLANVECLRELAKQAGSLYYRQRSLRRARHQQNRRLLHMSPGPQRQSRSRKILKQSFTLLPPPSKITAWRNASRAIDSCANYIIFGLYIGAYWDHVVFCLKPIAESGDGTWLTADMYWMPSPFGEVSMSLCSRPSLPSDLASAPNQGRIYNANRRRITSGYRITMTTRDPVEMPLPSFDLLELRWVLDRIARLAGIEEKCGHEDWEDKSEDFDSNADAERKEADAAATPLPQQIDNAA